MDVGNASRNCSTYSGYLTNNGSSDLSVDGSVTPVVFELPIPLFKGGELGVVDFVLCFNAKNELEGGTKFLDGLTALPNGITYGYRHRDDDTLIVVRPPITMNIDMLCHDPNLTIMDFKGKRTGVSCSLASMRIHVIRCNEAKSVFLSVNDDLTDIEYGQVYCTMYQV